jgi:GT2 family glycosyltransferase
MAVALPLVPAPPAAAPLPRPPARRPVPSREPYLTVVIVNYRQWPATARLVRRLRSADALRRGLAEVVIVDNHSSAHPAAALLRRLPGVSLRRWGRNRGFARAANEGCRLSQGEWLLLLNPDVSVAADFVDLALAAVKRLEVEEPRAGVVGLQLRNGDGSRQLSAGPFPTLAGTLGRLLAPRARRKYRTQQTRRRRPVPWVTGCGMAVRRACWQELGGFDEDFFLYYEDVDLCLRARARGWSVWYEPALRLVHHRPLHARRVPARLRFLTRLALLTYAAKHWPGWQFRFLAGVVRVEARLREWRARRLGRAAAAGLFAELRAAAADLAEGRPAAAGRRLSRVIRREEKRLERQPLGRHSQP